MVFGCHVRRFGGSADDQYPATGKCAFAVSRLSLVATDSGNFCLIPTFARLLCSIECVNKSFKLLAWPTD